MPIKEENAKKVLMEKYSLDDAEAEDVLKSMGTETTDDKDPKVDEVVNDETDKKEVVDEKKETEKVDDKVDDKKDVKVDDKTAENIEKEVVDTKVDTTTELQSDKYDALVKENQMLKEQIESLVARINKIDNTLSGITIVDSPKDVGLEVHTDSSKPKDEKYSDPVKLALEKANKR